jgi:cytochrome c oxidase cbb3-type subunit 3
MRLLLVLAAATGLAGCDRPPPPESLKVWTKDDHHSADDDRPASPQTTGTGAAAEGHPGAAGTNDEAQLVDITWRQQCVGCHGAVGRGDGPMGAMLHASDLTRADWQSKVKDAEIAATIRDGRNRMPKFDLPDSVLRGLVARIRSLRDPQ